MLSKIDSASEDVPVALQKKPTTFGFCHSRFSFLHGGASQRGVID